MRKSVEIHITRYGKREVMEDFQRCGEIDKRRREDESKKVPSANHCEQTSVDESCRLIKSRKRVLRIIVREGVRDLS